MDEGDEADGLVQGGWGDGGGWLLLYLMLTYSTLDHTIAATGLQDMGHIQWLR